MPRIRKTISVADASFAQLTFRFPDNTVLTHFIFETNVTINANTSMKLALRQSTQSAIGSNTTAGTLFYDKRQNVLSTNGAALVESRRVYPLYNLEVPKNKIFVNFYNALGLTASFTAILVYKKMKLR